MEIIKFILKDRQGLATNKAQYRQKESREEAKVCVSEHGSYIPPN